MTDGISMNVASALNCAMLLGSIFLRTTLKPRTTTYQPAAPASSKDTVFFSPVSPGVSTVIPEALSLLSPRLPSILNLKWYSGRWRLPMTTLLVCPNSWNE